MANPLKSLGTGMRSWFTARRPRPIRKHEPRRKPQLEILEDRFLPAANPTIGDVFYILMENHNLTQPSTTTSPQALQGNPAAPYLNSLMTPGNPNAAQTSWASAYHNAATGIHPSEPNYVWQEAGLAGPLNDADPYPNNIVNAPNLTALLQNYGVSWKSYQEDIDLIPNAGNVNQPVAGSLTSTVADPGLWTVPLTRFSGTSPDYVNPYNGSNQYDFAPKHDGTLFFKATNGGNDATPNNPEAQFYAPLQQLQNDLDDNTVARYSVITPDQFNDMHSSLNTDFTYAGTTWTHNTDQEAIAIGDNFLSMIVPKIMASQAYQNNGAIVIWFDETEGGDTSQFTLPEVVISPLAKGNAYKSTLNYTHSSDLKTLQELFGVRGPGGGFLGNANAASTNDLSGLFKVGALQSASISGKAFVDLSATGSFKAGDPLMSGLTVTLTGINSVNGQAVTLTTRTNSAGVYTFGGLLAGTYTITITPPPGYQNDFSTPLGELDDINLGTDQNLANQNFGFLVPGLGRNHGPAKGLSASASHYYF